MQTMFSKGYTVEEIAIHTGYTRLRVGEVLRQPWAQMNIVDDIQRSVQDEVKALLENEVLPSIKKQAALRDDPDAPKAVQLAAANALLDRFLGKPNQPITQHQGDPAQMSNKELEERVAKIVAGVATETGSSS
jgi:hypothetical protein